MSEPKTFYSKISGTRELYRVADLEGQLRNTIIAKMTDQRIGMTIVGDMGRYTQYEVAQSIPVAAANEGGGGVGVGAGLAAGVAKRWRKIPCNFAFRRDSQI